MTAILPLSALTPHRPCREQLDRVTALWPDGIPLTAEALDLAITHRVDLTWAVCLLADTSRVEYDRVVVPARVELDRVRADAQAVLDRVDRVTAPAQAEYDRVTAGAQVEYARVVAGALLAGLVAAYVTA